jgi:D-3-phosphoglycerate dehydrogenase / 2-oxoglutarate reductase
MRILVVEPIAPQGLAILRQRHEVDERLGLAPAELSAAIPEYDALVVRSQVRVDASLIAAGTRLRAIARAGVGLDNVDREAAEVRGIAVVNAPGGNTIAAAEHTMALLLAAARRIPAADASLRAGEWTRSRFAGTELRGKTLGIVGFGRIGQAVAERARAFGMRIVASDPFVTPDEAAARGAELVSFDEVLRSADVLTVHVPLTGETTGLIDGRALARLRRGAIVLNVARGGIVDEAALAEALASGHVTAAAVDVFEHEPPRDSPLLEAPNTVLTPHIAASTAEAQVAVAIEMAERLLEALSGDVEDEPAAVAAGHAGATSPARR